MNAAEAWSLQTPAAVAIQGMRRGIAATDGSFRK